MEKRVSYSLTPIEQNEHGINYQVRVEGPMNGWYDDVYFVIENEQGTRSYKIPHKENIDDKVIFESEVFLNTRAMYRYYFSYNIDGKHKFIKKKQMTEDDIYRDEMFKMSVNFSVPDWAKGKMMYHIFLDRFYRGSTEPLSKMPRRHIHKNWNENMQIGPDEEGIWNNDFYGGDIPGITEKLDYIQSLGVSILYISPPVFSQSNHRYDTSEYEKIDPYAGTNEDLRILCEEAHKRGMKVILDAVFNHTGSDSKYFNKFNSFKELGAYQSPNSPYYNYYAKHYNQEKNYILTEEDADKYHELRTELEEDWERYHDYYKGDDLCDIMCEEANERFNNKLRKLIRNSSVYELDVSYDKNAPDVPKFTVLG